MKIKNILKKINNAGIAFLALAITGTCQVNAQTTTFRYQGELNDSGHPANRSYDLQFNLFGVLVGGTALNPAPLIRSGVTMNDGVFSVSLDFGSAVFTGSDRFLEIGVRQAGTSDAFTILTPRQQITSSPYAIRALSAGSVSGSIPASQITGTLPASTIGSGTISSAMLANNAVTVTKIADGAIIGAKLANNTVSGVQITDELDLGAPGVCGSLDIFSTTAGTPGVSLLGCPSGEVRVFGSNGAAVARLSVQQVSVLPSYGLLTLNDARTNTSATLSAFNVGSFGPYLSLQDNSQQIVRLGTRSSVGELELYSGDTKRANVTGSGRIELSDTNGTETIEMVGSGFNNGAQIQLRDSRGTNTIQLVGADGTVDGGGRIRLYNGSGARTIELDADEGGSSRVTTQVLEITGGSDLSENFDITSLHSSPAPGMIVCIDSANPGQLRVSEKAYDPTVAGVMSGAGGVKPGMLMGQHGTAANGKHAVALTGRVYCFADAAAGAIQPGDLLTTSDTPGHAMRVSNGADAQGAIIGKAMTPLASGKGLVLILVSLQ